MSLSRESNFLELIEHGNPEALTLLANSPELFETGLELTLGGPEPLFHFAAYYKQQELLFDMFKLADKLIQEGRLEKSVIEAHMQILDHQGQGVLHLVAEMGSPSVLNDCLRYGAGLRAENKSHQTIQERAAVNNRLDILNHLTKLKMPLPPRDIDEIEEAELADGLDEAPLTRLYDINASSSLGNTPLHHYARGGMNDSTGEFLLANGANINALNNANKSPLRLLLMGASDSGFYLTPAQIHKATFLLERGARMNLFNLDELANLDHSLKSQCRVVAKPDTLSPHKKGNHITATGYDVEYKDLQYLRALIAEKTQEFEEAKGFYIDAANSGNVGAAVRLSSYHELKEDWESALKWYMSALKTFSHEVSFNRAVYLATEYLEQGGSIEEDFYRDFVHSLLELQDIYYVPAQTHLKLAHWISRLNENIDGISTDQRMKTALNHAALGYRQAAREESLELIEDAEEDINHFMILRLQQATSFEKSYCQRLIIPEHRDIDYYYQLSMQLSKLNLEELDHNFKRALEWYQIANILSGKSVPDPMNSAALKKAIRNTLKAEKEAGASLHGYSIFTHIAGQTREGLEVVPIKPPKKGTRPYE